MASEHASGLGPHRLSRAGVTRSAKAIRIRHDGEGRLFQAEVECVLDLGPEGGDARVARMAEIVSGSVGEVVMGEPLAIEELAEAIARRAAARTGAARAEVSVRAHWPVRRVTPISGLSTQESYRLIGVAAAGAGGGRRMIGVGAHGMNTSPEAQAMVREVAAEALGADGFAADEVERILSLVPLATHDQRARGTLYVGVPEGPAVRAESLLEIVLDAMSARTFELMKRPDERDVVERAHRRPRGVEDALRAMVSAVLARFSDLPDDALVHARQVHLETVHTHDVEGERWGTLGELRAEAAGVAPPSHTTPAAWLAAGAVAVGS